MADAAQEIGAQPIDAAVAAPPAAESLEQAGPDSGILQVEAPKRYDCSQWTKEARREYLLWGRRPPPIPSFTGLVEPAEAGKIGIACSGGGIRSAAFGLGALQALQTNGVLKRARYLAGVSGGSYIAAAFNMVRKTWESGDQPLDGEDGQDDSDPEKVTDVYPPFFPGSPEEQYLRNRSSYMAQGTLGKMRLVYRVLLGTSLNLAFITLAVIAISAPLSLLYGLIFPPLGAHLERGGLCAPLHHAAAGAVSRPVLCDFTPLTLPKALWLTLAIGAGLGLLTGAASILAYKWPTSLADFTETWSVRLLTIFGSLALVLLVLPIVLSVVRGWGAAVTKVSAPSGAIHGKGASEASGTGIAAAGAGGAATLGAAVLLQLRAQWSEAKTLASDVGKVRKWYAALTPRLRTALAYLIAAVIGPALTLAVALGAMTVTLNLAHPWERLVAAVGVPLVFLGLYAAVDMSAWSLHSFYRRRLCSAFALKRVAPDHDQPAIASNKSAEACSAAGIAVERDYARLVELSKTVVRDARGERAEWPTLLVCAAANISDTAATPPGRAVTSFTFSPTAIGGPLVGAVKTGELENACSKTRKRHLTLPAAVAMSGAAISPSMGKMTRWPLRFLMALANVRLGVWVPNPRRLNAFGPRGPLVRKVHKHYPKPRPSYLFRELFGVNSVNSRFLYVTDGGHYENLGLVELLRRGCTEVYVFDASNDNFGALGDAVSLARSELEVEIEIDYSPLQVDAAKNAAQTDCVIGKITFPDQQRSKGTLYYSRLVMPPKAPADVVAYQARDPRFPHDPTTDQLYTDQRFEAYRCLGAVAAAAALAKRPWSARARFPWAAHGHGQP
jgi:Patatin-like phospholipase